MNLKFFYWYFKSVLSPQFCDELIRYGKEQTLKLATTGKQTAFLKKHGKLNKKEIKNLKKTRDSNVVFFNDPWIYEKISPFLHEANVNAGWNFKIDWNESFQFTRYKKNQFYNWHQDSWGEPYDTPHNLNYHKRIRKLSLSCSLSDPKDYKGGELEFYVGSPLLKKQSVVVKEISPRGSLVVFPSYMWHRVRPVTKGKRYSLVMWALGDSFK
jgi:PKHD-type hydroxylase